MSRYVSVEKLIEMFHVFAGDHDQTFDVWGTNVTREMVKEYISNERFEKISFQVSTNENYDHAARIAYLVIDRDDEPIQLDVGCPCLGYDVQTLTDGYHRLAAAHIRGSKTIPTSVGGEVAYFHHLFVEPLPQYATT